MKLFVMLLILLPLKTSLAAELLTDIGGRLVNAEITEGRFRQEKHIKVLKKPLISTGTFIYHRSKGVIWQTLTPVPSVLLVNQTRLLTAQGEQSLPPAFGRVFTAMFGADVQAMKEGFDVSGIQNKATWQLQLKPKDALMRKVITGMKLSGDKDLRQIEINEANGNFSRITFEQIRHPETLTPAQESDFERLSSPR